MSPVSYLPPPEGCARLDTIVTEFGGRLAPAADAASITYALPMHARAEVRSYLSAYTRVEIPAGYVARLPGGRVYGCGNVLSPDGRWIARDVSEDFGKGFDEHWLLGYRRMRPPGFLPGRTAVIATTLGSGYGHWLLEELPRLLSLDLRECTAMIANVREPWARAALALHGFGGEVLPARRDAHWQCEELVVPGLATPAGYPTPEVVFRIREFAGRPGTPARGSGQRIYISREKARRRRVVNEAELWDALEARGFEKIFLEELSWAEQIALFRGARTIVGPHGAGLANLVFCPAGARVVELVNRTYFNPCYWRLSAIAGLDYRPVVADADQPIGVDLRANRDDVTVDIAQLCRALE